MLLRLKTSRLRRRSKAHPDSRLDRVGPAGNQQDERGGLGQEPPRPCLPMSEGKVTSGSRCSPVSELGAKKRMSAFYDGGDAILVMV